MKSKELAQSLLSVNRVLFLFIGIFAGSIVISDAWNLIPPSVVLQRWTLVTLMLIVNGAIWYAVRQTKSSVLLQSYAWILSVTMIAVATIMVFAQRGMASKAVALYVLPLIVISVLRSRAALLTTAILVFATYSLAVIRYFVTSPGEGYKVELYTELLFYGSFFFVVAGLLYALVVHKK